MNLSTFDLKMIKGRDWPRGGGCVWGVHYAQWLSGDQLLPKPTNMLVLRCILPFWPETSLTHSAPGRSDPFSSMGWVVAGWKAPVVLDPELCCSVHVYHVVHLVVDTEKIYDLLNGLVKIAKWGLKQVLNDKGMSQAQIGMQPALYTESKSW